MPRNSQKAPPTPGALQRRFTTLSLEVLNRVGAHGESPERSGGPHGVFTDNLSASSRAPPPPFVVRHGTVVGANMPDTVQLASHRGKVYIGLQDPVSASTRLSGSTSGRQSKRAMSRGDKRERTSAATTIGRASIIDWADNSTESARERAPLSGELSFMLPPVTKGQQEMLSRPPPGLDTADLLRYRPNPAGTSPNRSPPPRSRAGARPLQHGARPPQNTPSRPDDFSASLRKSVSPRRSVGVSGVMILGGGIRPPLDERWSSHREQIVLRHSRSQTFISPREVGVLTDRSSQFRKHRGGQGSRSMGRANFELPMIDLKCVESPIANLGNLEEKGIRLVRLRRVRRASKRKAPTRQDSDVTNDQSQQGDEDDPGRVSHDDEDFDKFTRISGKMEDDILEKAESIPDKQKDEVKVDLTPRSTTSSASNASRAAREADEQSVIGTNREPYSTPLLPNITPQDTARGSYTTTTIDTPSARLAPPTGPSLPFIVTVDKVTPTPTKQVNTDENLYGNQIDGDSEDKDDDVWSESGPPTAGARRMMHRSSSLLSVPASDTSERRPKIDTHRPVEETANLGLNIDETDDSADGMINRTIATQTAGREETDQ
ncbi:hypothetical protein PoB_000971600 [Plakobranchus ocellatus]|uniref:Uncharacterized protein n=1 Tax=Plakobranchus ocellatus TaxID=259542 RepID=A0AAV3Y7G7_9GAST|nr:hypothetical protein PoB_000971600 [Plakobranchus ocellatus]